MFDASNNFIGLSRNCSAPVKVVFVYRSTANTWKDYVPGMPRPADMATTTTIDGLTVDFIVRWERGTINRFIYSFAVLAPGDDTAWELNRDAWNKRVIYRFDGGVAIGHTQGGVSTSAMLYDVGLSRGYAILHSSGNRTSTHYNLQLGGETALMVKERFIERYDVPLYTVGVGGSGGAIQQYVYAQNHPGLIDAAIPQYSYPDMVTQAVHVGDCELLEFYMDVLDGANPRWATWTNRTILEGLAASNTLVESVHGTAAGLTECINGWRGLSPLALNPLYGAVPNQQLFEPQSAIAATEWTHFADIVNIVGRGSDGYARRYWDNVGVQYGLQAVASGQITPDEFLKLNAVVGGWKAQPDMIQEGCPFFPTQGCSNAATWDPWSRRNQVYGTSGVPAPRTQGDIEAMREVYKSGLVFMGDIDIPIIDWRNYLEDELDMHNSHQSFASRKRMLNADGDASNQVIWFTDVVVSNQRFDQTPEALDVMDEWMRNIFANPGSGVAGNKPALATDRCFDETGTEIARGPAVWDGIIDGNAAWCLHAAVQDVQHVAPRCRRALRAEPLQMPAHAGVGCPRARLLRRVGSIRLRGGDADGHLPVGGVRLQQARRGTPARLVARRRQESLPERLETSHSWSGAVRTKGRPARAALCACPPWRAPCLAPRRTAAARCDRAECPRSARAGSDDRAEERTDPLRSGPSPGPPRTSRGSLARAPRHPRRARRWLRAGPGTRAILPRREESGCSPVTRSRARAGRPHRRQTWQQTPALPARGARS